MPRRATVGGSVQRHGKWAVLYLAEEESGAAVDEAETSDHLESAAAKGKRRPASTTIDGPIQTPGKQPAVPYIHKIDP